MRKCVAVLLALSFALPLGCGTLLYRERVGQPRGKLDAFVVMLDSIALVYFVVPGLIAFAVDFATGAIYLPREAPPPLAGAPSRVQLRMLGEGSRDPRAIAQVVREVAGIELSGDWNEVQVVEGIALAELLELDRCARGNAGLDPAAEPRAPAFRSCARR
jgi:hypothetical protein